MIYANRLWHTFVSGYASLGNIWSKKEQPYRIEGTLSCLADNLLVMVFFNAFVQKTEHLWCACLRGTRSSCSTSCSFFFFSSSAWHVWCIIYLEEGQTVLQKICRCSVTLQSRQQNYKDHQLTMSRIWLVSTLSHLFDLNLLIVTFVKVIVSILTPKKNFFLIMYRL